jgi:hypothetical protein
MGNLSNSGSLRILNSTISGNAGDGIGVFNGSSADLTTPAVTITGNGGNVVSLFDGASADIQFASITSNGGQGRDRQYRLEAAPARHDGIASSEHRPGCGAVFP